jgi:hypothetical protein
MVASCLEQRVAGFSNTSERHIIALPITAAP